MRQTGQKFFYQIACATSIVCQGVFAQGAVAGVISYHTERAVIAGNGCNASNSTVSVDEFGDLSIGHDNLAIVLPANGSDHALAARKTCIVRVPVTIPRGFYVKSIQQQIMHGAAKSAGAEIRVSSRASFSSDNISPFTILLPHDEDIYAEFMIDSRTDVFSDAQQQAKYCRPDRPEEQMFQLNVALTGSRDSIHESLVSAAYGSHFGEGLEIEVRACESLTLD
jgi:hypothetical protein